MISGCQILERHCHSIDAYGANRFYLLGQDASIAYGYKDLIIRNNSSIALQLRLQVLPETGQVISSLWGQAPCPWEVKVNSMILQEMPSPLANGISGWIVATQRYQRERPDKLTAKTRSNPIAEEAAWRIDYHTISVYKPCVESDPDIAVER